MTLTIESPTKEERRARRLEFMRRIRNNPPEYDPKECLSPDEMIALLNRHERAILEAAKRAGLSFEDEYERKHDDASSARQTTRDNRRRGLLARLRLLLLGKDYERLETEEKKAREELEFLTRERDALIEAARRGGLI